MSPRRPTLSLHAAVDVAEPRSVWHRMRQALPVIGQCAVTAGAAWWIAGSVFGHDTPVFAATAAVICLAAGVGRRGRRAVDLIAGVLSGVAVGQVIRLLDVGVGFWQIVLAVALAMALAALFDARPVAFIQSGTAVLIVLTLEPPDSPLDHVLDAAVGGVLGLLGSQVLFSPDPVKLMVAPVREILDDATEALRIAAEALRKGSTQLADASCERAQDAHARLGELARARMTARRVTARTVRGRDQAARLRHVDQRLDDIDVLVAAVLLLCDDVRDHLAARPVPAPARLPDRLVQLAAGLAELAARPLSSTADMMSGPEVPRRAPGTPGPAVPAAPDEVPDADVHLRHATAALHRLRAAAES